MVQETHPIEDHGTQTVIKANTNNGQSFVRNLQLSWGTVRKIVSAAAIGFHAFVQNGEIKNPTQNDYWWNSADHVEDLFKH